jgi:hypothetical protein
VVVIQIVPDPEDRQVLRRQLEVRHLEGRQVAALPEIAIVRLRPVGCNKENMLPTQIDQGNKNP